jgi:hypothetical protein
MASDIGSACDIRWLYSTGTQVLGGDFRSFSYTPSVNLIDETAGSDPNKLYLKGQVDGQAQLTALFQTGTNTGGTTQFSTLAEGNFGTLIYSKEGTATTKPKVTIPAYSQGVSISFPYDNCVEVSVSWQQSGARVEGTN